MIKARTIIMLGVQEGKSEEEIKDLMDELKLCAKQDIEKVTPKSIANKPWYFITFKDQAQRNQCLRIKGQLRGTNIYIRADLSKMKRDRRKARNQTQPTSSIRFLSPMDPNAQQWPEMPVSPWWHPAQMAQMAQMDPRIMYNAPRWQNRRR